MFPKQMFESLECTVIALARAERGRGLPPRTRFGRAIARLLKRVTGEAGVRPLADPRLEALRAFVNALARPDRARKAELAAVRAAGFDQRQIAALSGLAVHG